MYMKMHLYYSSVDMHFIATVSCFLPFSKINQSYRLTLWFCFVLLKEASRDTGNVCQVT